MKKIGSLFLCLILLCAGCSHFPEKNESGISVSSLQLEFWDIQWGNSLTNIYTKSMESLIENYHKENPNLKISLRLFPWDNYYEMLLTSIISDSEPDICSGFLAQPVLYASMDKLLDLTPIINQWETEKNSILKEMDPSYFTLYQFNNRQIAIPFALDGGVLYYRTDYFEEAGISELPKSLKDFDQLLKDLKTYYPDKTPFSFSAQNIYSANRITSLLMDSNGGTSMTAESFPNFHSRNNIASFQYLKNWMQNNLLAENSRILSQEEAEKDFLEGNSCIILSSLNANWLYSSDLYSVCAILNNPNGPYTVHSYMSYSPYSYYGFSSTDYPKETRALIKWLTENNLSLFDNGGMELLPIRSSYFENIAESNRNLKSIKETIDRYGRLSVYPQSDLYPFHASLYGEQIYCNPTIEILSGADVVEALERTDELYRRSLIKITDS